MGWLCHNSISREYLFLSGGMVLHHLFQCSIELRMVVCLVGGGGYLLLGTRHSGMASLNPFGQTTIKDGHFFMTITLQNGKFWKRRVITWSEADQNAINISTRYKLIWILVKKIDAYRHTHKSYASSVRDSKVYLKHPPDSSSRIKTKLGIVVIHYNMSVIADTQLK